MHRHKQVIFKYYIKTTFQEITVLFLHHFRLFMIFQMNFHLKSSRNFIWRYWHVLTTICYSSTCNFHSIARKSTNYGSKKRTPNYINLKFYRMLMPYVNRWTIHFHLKFETNCNQQFRLQSKLNFIRSCYHVWPSIRCGFISNLRWTVSESIISDFRNESHIFNQIKILYDIDETILPPYATISFEIRDKLKIWSHLWFLYMGLLLSVNPKFHMLLLLCVHYCTLQLYMRI